MDLRTEREANEALQFTAEERAYLDSVIGRLTNEAKPCPRGDCGQGRDCDCLVQFCGAMDPRYWIPRTPAIHGPYRVSMWARFKRWVRTASDWIVDPEVRS